MWQKLYGVADVAVGGLCYGPKRKRCWSTALLNLSLNSSPLRRGGPEGCVWLVEPSALPASCRRPKHFSKFRKTEQADVEVGPPIYANADSGGPMKPSHSISPWKCDLHGESGSISTNCGAQWTARYTLFHCFWAIFERRVSSRPRQVSRFSPGDLEPPQSRISRSAKFCSGALRTSFCSGRSAAVLGAVSPLQGCGRCLGSLLSRFRAAELQSSMRPRTFV